MYLRIIQTEAKMGFVTTSRSGIILDILLVVIIIFQAVYIGLFRNVDLGTISLAMGSDFYFLTWVTSGGYLILVGILFISSFFDGDSTRRSWFAIFAMIVGGALYFTLAIAASIHVFDLDHFKYTLSNHQYRTYKFLLAADYILAAFFWLDGGLRVMLRLRSGDGKS